MNNNEKKFEYSNLISIQDFSKKLEVNSLEVIKYFFLKGVPTTINSALNEEHCKELCKFFKIKFQILKKQEKKNNIFDEYLKDNEITNLCNLSPVVVIMGHVDHGKTTLLDKIKKTNIASKEYSSITQHIGAYQIKYNDFNITFLDTPGHESFTKMRSMGGKVANIAVIVVSATDGIKPQTIESINHAINAKAKIIIFINKVDKGKSGIPAIKKILMTHGVVLEDFGGETICLEGSAIKNEGIDNLLEVIKTISELEDKKTTLNLPGLGTIIEAKITKGLGPSATIILERGTLSLGNWFVSTKSFGKIKNIVDENKKTLKKIIPSQPAKISGLNCLPEIGRKFLVLDNEKQAKSIYGKILKKNEEKIFSIEEENENKISLIIKADVFGSLEAIKNLIQKFEIKIINYSVGEINDSDLNLAKLSNSIIINFNQKVSNNISKISKNQKTILKSYKSVYEIEEDVKDWINKNTLFTKVENIIGEAKVVKIWTHSKIGTISGCIMQSGKINIKHKVKVVRNGEDLEKDLNIKTFKTEQFEIKESKTGQECGIVLGGWNDIQINDLIVSYEMIDKID